MFNTGTRVLFKRTPVTHALDGFYKALARIEPDGGTRITAGLTAAAELMRHAPPRTRRRVVLLSDGADGGSAIPVATSMKEDGCIIDVIGIGGCPAAVGEAYLRELASVVGGCTRYRFIADKDTLLSHFASIATDIMCVR